MTSEICCGTCKFWLHIEGNEGVCRRYPPRYTGHDEPYWTHNFWAFPETEAEDWCGEFRIRQVAVVERKTWSTTPLKP